MDKTLYWRLYILISCYKLTVGAVYTIILEIRHLNYKMVANIKLFNINANFYWKYNILKILLFIVVFYTLFLVKQIQSLVFTII